MFNLHSKLIGTVPMVYRDPVSATIFSTVVSGLVSMDNANKQEHIADKNRAKQEEAQKRAEEEANRIARETKPDGEKLGDIQLGSSDSEMGNIGDFLRQQQPKGNALGAKNISILGF